MQSALTMLWIMWTTFLFAMAGYTALSFFAVVHVTPNPILIRVISVFAATEVVVLLFLRRKVLAPATLVLAARPDDAGALARWKAAHIITWAMGLSVGLYGLVLRYTGFPFSQLTPFFIAAFVVLLFYFPRPVVAAR